MKIIKFTLDGDSGSVEAASGMMLPQILQTAAENGVTVKRLEMFDLQLDAETVKIPDFIRREQ